MKRRTAAEPRPGATWHGYAIERVIARPYDGVKASTAYYGRAADGAPVVVKMFNPDPKLRPEQVAWWRASFEYERRALLALDHPAIPKLLAADFARPRPMLVMQRMPGDDLRHTPALSRAATLLAARGVAATVAHVHAHGWAHQDIRQDHVLFLPHGEASVIDFGSARPRTVDGARQDLQALGAIVMWLAVLPSVAPATAALLVADARDREDMVWGLLMGGPQGLRAIGCDPLVTAATRCRAGELDAAGLAQAIAEIEEGADANGAAELPALPRQLVAG